MKRGIVVSGLCALIGLVCVAAAVEEAVVIGEGAEAKEAGIMGDDQAGVIINAEEGLRAHILVRRTLVESDAYVTGKNLTVSLFVINIGNAVAKEVELLEEWPSTCKLSVPVPIVFTTIEPEEEKNITYSINCEQVGEYEIAPSKFTYQLDGKTTKLVRGLTTPIGKVVIQDAAEYAHRTNPRRVEWLVFVIICALLVGGPFAGWSYYQLKYDNGNNGNSNHNNNKPHRR
ncbi:hypothetical protein Pelo_8776 [Pelomyxa schiedti]|nr:hypothetical protein Pelo_8776 [Pelomyxa schiedti]